MFKFSQPVAVDPGSASRFVGQGPQCGGPSYHAANEVVDSPLAGVDDFTPGNTADDAIMQIATGSAGAQNPAPDTALAGNDGPAGEPGPVPGSPNPAPRDPGLNPGPQGSGKPVPGLRHHAGMTKDVHDSSPPNSVAAQFGQRPPNSASGVMNAIQTGCDEIGGCAGATCSEGLGDVSLAPIDAVPVPPARDAFNPAQVVVPISQPVRQNA